MRQTAVEWILNKVWDLDDENFTVPNRLIEMLEQAKEMEKDIIIEAYSQGRIDEETRFPYATDGEDYFKLEFTQSSE